MAFQNRFLHHRNVRCGIVIPDQGDKPVPLKGVKVDVKILDCTASVRLEQKYKNLQEK